MDQFFPVRSSVRLLALSAVIFIIGMGISSAQYVYFPSANTADGRMLSLAGTALRTVENDIIAISLAAPSTATSIEIGIFDGETSGMWDQGDVQMEFRIFADPLGDNSGSTQIGSTYTGAVMGDNQWYTITIPTAAIAQAPNGDYFYVLRISNPQPTVAWVWSNFKVRAANPVTISTHDFAFTASLLDLGNVATRSVIYPAWPSLTPTTYDGNWDLYINVPEQQNEFVIWDGDLDYGAVDCSTRDTDDADTPNDQKPSWSAPSIRFEGVAVGFPCTGGASGYGSGDPPDQGFFASFRRGEDIRYSITLPNSGPSFLNADPTGNLEWEQFRISAIAGDPLPKDFTTTSIPEGNYRLHIDGMDMGNLNAYRLVDQCITFVGVDASGSPVTPLTRCGEDGSLGTGTPGYWKNHPEAWPVQSITIGGKTFSKADAIKKILNGKGGDKWITLATHTICAKLNRLIGNRADCVSGTILLADAWLAQHYSKSTIGGGKGISGGGSEWKVGEPYSITLDKYNNGLLCAPHRDSGGLN